MSKLPGAQGRRVSGPIALGLLASSLLGACAATGPGVASEEANGSGEETGERTAEVVEALVSPARGDFALWDDRQKLNLTYCMDRASFSSAELTRVTEALDRARTAWSNNVFVTFAYARAEDARCSLKNDAVVFVVRGVPELPPRALGESLVSAFGPSDYRSRREMLVAKGALAAPDADVDRAFLHALGHVLGLGHELDDTCAPVLRETRLGPPYPGSIMAPAACGGASQLTARDIRYVQMLYGAPLGKCARESADLCTTFGATCEAIRDVDGARSDLCRWNTSRSEEACQASNGVWLAKDHPLAERWPTLVPALRRAACVKLLGGLRCPVAEQRLCERHGAQCELTVGTNDRVRNLCRWRSTTTEAACHTTSAGIWTTAGSSFAEAWPTSVPSGDGACITQVNNLKCTDDERRLCEELGGLCEVSTVAGARRNVCRWAAAPSAARCGSTFGAWTRPEDPFAVEHPGAVRSPAAGACVAEVATLPRVWERGCGVERPRRFLFERKDAARRCNAVAPGGSSSWRVSDAVVGLPDGLCLAEWTGAAAPSDADRDTLQGWALTVSSTGVVNLRTGEGSSIRAVCGSASPVCAAGACPPGAGGGVRPEANPLKVRDLASGCPKCAVVTETSLFAVLDPAMRSRDLLAVPLSGGAPTTAALQVNGGGQQIVEIPLSPADREALGNPSPGSTFALITEAQLSAINDQRRYDFCSAPFPPPYCAGGN